MFTVKNMLKCWFGPYFGNINLTESLKDKLKACVGKNRDAICEIDSPEILGVLLAVNARGKIQDAGVARHLSIPELWNGILGLKHQPEALDGRGDRLKSVTRDSFNEEKWCPIFKGQFC